MTEFDDDFGVKPPISAGLAVKPLTGRPAPYASGFQPDEGEEEENDMKEVTIAFNKAIATLEDIHFNKSKEITDYIDALERKLNLHIEMLKRINGNLCQRCACDLVSAFHIDSQMPYYNLLTFQGVERKEESESEDEETKALEKFLNEQEANNPNWGKVDKDAQVNPVSPALLKQLVSSHISTLNFAFTNHSRRSRTNARPRRLLRSALKRRLLASSDRASIRLDYY